MSVTLEQVALKANVAKSAVSVVLRGHPVSKRYKKETCQRIFDAAKELGYQPNFFASQLRAENKRVLMLCLSYLQDAYSSTISEGFVRKARERGYQIVISVFQDTEEPHAFENEILGRHSVSAMAVVGSGKDKLTDEAIAELANDGVSILLVGRKTGLPKVNEILVDEYAGCYEMAKYIYQQGAQNVWAISHRQITKKNELWVRAQAIKDYAEQHGFCEPCILNVVFDCSPRSLAEAAYIAVLNKIKESGPPHAIIANGDYFAYGAIAAVSEMGLCIGKDIAVTGFDDAWQSEFTTPPLTTIRQPMQEMGKLAADVLIDTIEGKIAAGRKVSLTPELIVRKSGCFCPSNK